MGSDEPDMARGRLGLKLGLERRAHNDLELRVPDVLPRARHGKGAAYGMEAECIDGLADFPAALERARDAGTARLLEIKTP